MKLDVPGTSAYLERVEAFIFTDRFKKISLVFVALSHAIFLWFNKSVRGFDVTGDVQNVWLPFAKAVLSGGEPYVAAWDNKPPLFHFLNIPFAATDQYLFF